MKTFWEMMEQMDGAPEEAPSTTNDANPPKQMQQLKLFPTDDFDAIKQRKKEVGDAYKIMQDNIPTGIRNHIDDHMKKNEFDGASDQLLAMRYQHPMMDVINGYGVRNEQTESEIYKRFQKMQDLKRAGGSKKELSPYFKMRQDLKDGADGLVDKLPMEFMDSMEDWQHESAEITSDSRHPDDDMASRDIIREFLPEFNEVMEDIPSNVQDKFFRILEEVQHRYKKGDDFESLLTGLMDAPLEDNDRGTKEFYGYNTYYDSDDVDRYDEDIEFTNEEINEEDPIQEIAWSNIVEPRVLERLKGEEFEGFGDRLKAILTREDQPTQQRAMFLLNKYAEKSGKSLEEILGDGEGIDGWIDFVKKFTPLDARRTWKDQVLPNFEDGTVFRNQPASGGRGYNHRERIYKRAGFGDLMGDDYQYGYKKGDGALTPITEDDGNFYNEEAARERLADSLPDFLDGYEFVGDFDWQDVMDYIELDNLDVDTLRMVEDDPSSFVDEMYKNARENYYDTKDITDHEEVQDMMTQAYARLDDVDEDLEDEFQQYVYDWWETRVNYDMKDEIVRAAFDEDEDAFDEMVETLYNKFKREN